MGDKGIVVFLRRGCWAEGMRALGTQISFSGHLLKSPDGRGDEPWPLSGNVIHSPFFLRLHKYLKLNLGNKKQNRYPPSL